MSFLSRYGICVVKIPQPNLFSYFKDIKGNWKKLGAGSFGNVYKGQPFKLEHPPILLLTPPAATYLGIDVAIKEVLPSTDYDVAKYFEREWRLMKSASI